MKKKDSPSDTRADQHTVDVVKLAADPIMRAMTRVRRALDALIEQTSRVEARLNALEKRAYSTPQPGASRRCSLGLGPIKIGPNSTERIERVHGLDHAFVPRRLLYASDLTGVVIESITIGEREQVVSGGVPASVFAMHPPITVAKGAWTTEETVRQFRGVVTRVAPLVIVVRNTTEREVELLASIVGHLESDAERGQRLALELEQTRADNDRLARALFALSDHAPTTPPPTFERALAAEVERAGEVIRRSEALTAEVRERLAPPTKCAE